MIEIEGDLWDFHERGHYIVITTNGDVRKDGCCVMGRGIAEQAALKFPTFQKDVGGMIKAFGNNVYKFDELWLITFPVKHHFKDRADLKLIVKSCNQIVCLPDHEAKVYMPRPGCGNGRLLWDVVKPVIAPLLDSRFTIVERNPS